MDDVLIAERVDSLEAILGKFIAEAAVINKRADDRQRAAERRFELSEERHKAAEKIAEERHLAAEERHKAAEERNKAAEERLTRFERDILQLNQTAEERHIAAEERHKAAEERNKAAEERLTRFEQDMSQLNQTAEERNKAAEERNKAAEERLTRFEQDMRKYREETNKDIKEMKRQWGDLSNKLGTIIEDVLAPNLPRLAEEIFKLGEVIKFSIRNRRVIPGTRNRNEFDTVVECLGGVVVGEAKSNPSIEYAEQFLKKMSVFFDFYPECKGKKVIPVFGSWSIPAPVITRLTELGIYALQMGEDTMELVNAKELASR